MVWLEEEGRLGREETEFSIIPVDVQTHSRGHYKIHNVLINVIHNEFQTSSLY